LIDGWGTRIRTWTDGVRVRIEILDINNINELDGRPLQQMPD